MMDNHDEPGQWSRETDLPEYRLAKQQKELERSDLALQLELSSAIRDLRTHPGWLRIHARLSSIEHEETVKLRFQRMDSYELGRRQGLLTALRHMTQTEPMSAMEVDNAVARIRLLTQQIDEIQERVLS
jgi:hypothetical protein